MKKLPFLLFILFGLLFAVACDGPVEEAHEDNEEVLEDTALEEEAEFAVDMANYFLVTDALNQMALDRVQDDEILAFVNDMRADHNKMFSELKQLAAQANITLPAEASEEELEDFADEIEDEEVEDVAEAYLERMIEMHQAFAEMSKDRISDTEFKEFLDFSRRVNSQQYVHLNSAQRLLGTVED